MGSSSANVFEQISAPNSNPARGAPRGLKLKFNLLIFQLASDEKKKNFNKNIRREEWAKPFPDDSVCLNNFPLIASCFFFRWKILFVSFFGARVERATRSVELTIQVELKFQVELFHRERLRNQVKKLIVHSTTQLTNKSPRNSWRISMVFIARASRVARRNKVLKISFSHSRHTICFSA